MLTAQQIVSRALRLINVVGEGRVASAEEAQDALRGLNAMLGDWKSGGVDLGLTLPLVLTDTIVLPVDAPVDESQIDDALSRGLAERIAHDFNAPDSAVRSALADATWRRLQVQYWQMNESRADDYVPRWPWGR